MARQFGRVCQIYLGTDAGEALDVSDLRCSFVIEKGNYQILNVLDLTIHNPNYETVRRTATEFTRIIVVAGYSENLGKIFEGAIRWKRYGRTSPTDTYLNLQAADGELGVSFTVVGQTLTAAYTQKDVERMLVKAYEEVGITLGFSTTDDARKAPRGRVLFGMTRDLLRVHADTNVSTTSVQNGKLQVVHQLAVKPGEAAHLTYETGMLGLPHLTLNGLEVRCLLNPSIEIDGRIKVDETSVQDIKLSTFLNIGGLDAAIRPDIAKDGLYKVVWLRHVGDTYGEEWHTDIIGVVVDGTLPITRQAIGMGVKVD